MTGRAALAALAAAVVAGAAGLTAKPARAGSPQFVAPVAVDGPSTDIDALGGVAVARDGGGGVVYLKDAGGVAHVFASRLVGGTFAAPEQLDATLPGASSQPVIAAGDGGTLLVAFVNAGDLYVVTRTSAASPWSAPVDLLSGAGASNPAIAMSIHGKGYLAFTTTRSGGHDVRAAYYVGGAWALAGGPLDADPAGDAGTGDGRPAVTAVGDGVGIVVWGESGHLYARRVWATAPSVVFEQADPPSIGGLPEASAGLPDIASGDDSSYAYVTFREIVGSGSTTQSRVLMRRLHGSLFDGPIAADGLASPGSEGAVQPRIATSPAFRGLLTSARDDTNALFVTVLGQVQPPAPPLQLSPPTTALPAAVPTTTGNYSALVAWQQQPPLGPAEVDARFFDGTRFGSVLVASQPSMGTPDATLGLDASGDASGNVAVAWVQGTGASEAIVAGRFFYPPGSFGPVAPPPYATSAHPTFAWSAARELWGPVTYAVTVDGVPITSTSATSVTVPVALADGRHVWQITAVNAVAETTVARAVPVFVDTVRPLVQFALTGSERAGHRLRLLVRDTDAPVGSAPGSASGIASAAVAWGDGTTTALRHGAVHAYARAGAYRLRVSVSDRAGNVTVLSRRVRIAR